jgi:DNA (cytosine-5)-methyltransferase 1
VRELSLFTGAGGGILGTKLLGWTPIGYVEWDDYCQRVLKQRQEDGLIERAPIFGDIRTFISEGYAERYRGMVDVITAGFPCQPFSSASAGKGQGESDERNMWPETWKVISMVRPKYFLLENVPRLLTNKYFRKILGEMVTGGYVIKWDCLPACSVSAPHERDRLWIYGYTNDKRQSDVAIHDETQGMPEFNANSSNSSRCSELGQQQEERRQKLDRIVWWKTEPNISRMDDGMASRMDRIKAIGNGQVPAVVRAAWELLSG